MIRAALIAAAVALGCGDDGGDELGPSFTVDSDPGDPHPHTLTIFEADLAAGLPRTYVTGGGPDHEHAVDISGTEMTAIEAGEPVTVELTDGHPHRFDIVRE